MGNIIVGALILGAVVFIVRSKIQNKKKGNATSCHGDCGNCGGHCK